MDPANVRDGKVYFEGLPTSPFRIEGIDEYTVLKGKIRAVNIEGLWVFLTGSRGSPIHRETPSAPS